MRHHDQSCDRTRHWTSLVCVSIRFGSLLARIVSVIGLSVERTSSCCMSRTSACWLPDYLVRVARLTRYINGSMLLLCLCIFKSVYKELL